MYKSFSTKADSKAVATKLASIKTEISRTANATSASDPKIIYLDRVCRTCLMEREKDQLKDLFQCRLAETIMSCTRIMVANALVTFPLKMSTHVAVTESDGLPCHICTSCCEELERCFNFQQMTKASDATIRSLIEKSVVIKQDSETKYEVLNVVLTDSQGNAEASAIVVPLEELRFQLINSNNSVEQELQNIKPDSESEKSIENCPLAIESSVKGTDDCPLNINPVSLANESTATVPPNNDASEHLSAARESTILRNLKQELSEFIGSNCTAISKEVEIVDVHEDDEMINVDYLKDALTEEYIQIMETQLAPTLPSSKEEQLEQEHLHNLIHASMEAEEPRDRQQREHANESDTMHCKICDVQFNKRRLYWKHVHQKHSEVSKIDLCADSDYLSFFFQKRFECQLCSKKFAENAALKSHMLRHTGEKTHVCDCHMRKHTGEEKAKKVACSICSKAFSANHDLLIHMRTHTKEKPYGCSVCEKRFMLRVHLTVHMRSHTGEKPFACSLCEK
uniref:Protein krueppel n=1 Tax=Anopheles epiroticus TaxID=199890 RepID=A0A182PR65_9DIPT